MISQNVLGLVCAKLGQNEFGGMATMRIVADQDSMVLKLESEFDAD
jgi:hypothetical protein